MGLRFIIGRAGTGKTHLCIEEIIHQSNTGAKRQILIVPEQFTSQAERDLIAATGQNAILTAEVLSFGRLAHRVFSKKGIGNRLPLGDIGKAMALRKILLAEKDNISYFHSVLEQPGFIDQLGLTISEFFQYRISPENTETLAQAEGLPHAAREKLTDLNRIYRSYLDFLRQEYISADETLGLLAERLDESLGFADTEFWLDGFYGFPCRIDRLSAEGVEPGDQYVHVNSSLSLQPPLQRGGFSGWKIHTRDINGIFSQETYLTNRVSDVMIDKDIIQENKRIRKHNSCTRTGIF